MYLGVNFAGMGDNIRTAKRGFTFVIDVTIKNVDKSNYHRNLVAYRGWGSSFQCAE